MDDVVFTGIRSEIPELMNIFDVFLLPSITEGLGIVVVEAQVSGLPCIVSNGVPKEVVIDEKLVQFLTFDKMKWIESIKQSLCIKHHHYIDDMKYDIQSTCKFLEKFIVVNKRMNKEKSDHIMINNELKEYTRDESLILKGIAILFMLGLHLYNRDVTTGFYEPWIYIGDQPFIYYISFMFDACVPIYCFIAGCAAYIKKDVSLKKQSSRIFELLINYWVIVLITIMLGIVLHHNKIPGSFSIVLGNLFLYKITYVGAWWFMQTYMLLFLTSKCMIKIIDYMHPVVMSIVIFIIYIVSYYFRMMNPVLTDDQFINEIVNIIILYGTSLFSYCVGIMFKKYFIISILRDGLKKYSNIFGVVIIISCFIVHIIIKSMIVAPFTALLFICGFSLLTLNSKLKKVLCFMGKHSTNIWLIHMQFYMLFIFYKIFG